jgi:hypothetical protein
MKIRALLVALIASVAVAATSPPNSVVIAPSTAVLTDAAGNTWGINASAPCTATWAPAGTTSEVVINGTLDATSCKVTEIAIDSTGLVWQFNGVEWYSRASPTAAWSGGTTTSPLPVTPTYLAQATITWSAPLVNADGSPISGPLTYDIYRGSTATALTKLTSVSALTYVDPAGSPTPTTYYYAVAANYAGGNPGAETNVVPDTIAAAVLVPGVPTGLAVH